MKRVLRRIFLKNWPRKIVAFLSALVIWFLVSQSITVTRTIPDVRVRITNLMEGKTVLGMLPNGFLSKGIAVTVTGTKSVINDLTANDIEVVINAAGREQSWIAKIDRNTVVDLTASGDLLTNITDIKASDLFIKMTKLVTEDIPIKIRTPIGDPPKGYLFLDVWPRVLIQKVSGPEEEVKALQRTGLRLTFDLDQITYEDLTERAQRGNSEEVSYFIPDSWKKIAIPFLDGELVDLNDPRAQYLRIDFLKQELLSLDAQLPIGIFFPLKYSKTFNPETLSLGESPIIEKKNGLSLLSVPLYVRDVSRLFIDIVKDHIQFTVIAGPEKEESLDWAIEFIDEPKLEDAYVSAFLAQEEEKYQVEPGPIIVERFLRYRFRDYLQQLGLYDREGNRLKFSAKVEKDKIRLTLP